MCQSLHLAVDACINCSLFTFIYCKCTILKFIYHVNGDLAHCILHQTVSDGVAHNVM